MNPEKESNDNIPNLTKPIIAFLSVTGLLSMASILQTTTPALNVPIASQKAFAQEEKKTPAETISTVKALLNQTINEYRNKNFTGAQVLASSAYLDHFEFIEAPLEKHDKVLKEKTEIMLREQLRQAIKDKSQIENIQQLINNIKANLDKAQALLSNESPVQTIPSKTSSTTNQVIQ
jgi:valyl-tRNA synthetase